MDLKRSDGATIHQPTPEQVTDAVARLSLAPDGFVILARAAEEYVQVAAGTLEARSAGRHHRAARTPASVEQAQRVFAAFLDGGDGWRDAIAWTDADELLEQEHAERGRRRGGPRKLVIGLALLLGFGAYYWWLASS